MDQLNHLLADLELERFNPALYFGAWWPDQVTIHLPWAIGGATMTGTSLMLVGLSRREKTDFRYRDTLIGGTITAIALLMNYGLEGWMLLLLSTDQIGLAGHLAGAMTAVQLGYGINMVRVSAINPAMISMGVLCWSALSSFLPQLIMWFGQLLNLVWLSPFWVFLGNGVAMTVAPILFWLIRFEKLALFQQLTSSKVAQARRAFDLIRLKGEWHSEAVQDHLARRHLSHLPLAGQTLKDFDLRGVSLRNAALSQCQLLDCDLRRANLSGATLTNASLAGSDLSGASLLHAQTENLDLTDCLYDRHTVWPNGFDVKNSRAIGPGAMLKGQNLSGVQLDGADLKGANLGQADLSRASLVGANLERTSLRGTHFQRADLTGANLKGATLKGALYDEATRWPKGFDPEKRGAVSTDSGSGLSG